MWLVLDRKQSGVGTRSFWDPDVMGDVYTRATAPEFFEADDGRLKFNPSAEVAEALVEKYDHIQPLDPDAPADDGDGADADAAADADGDTEDADTDAGSEE